jgi:hypothetical protein
MNCRVFEPAGIRPPVAAGGGQAVRQQAGERRRRASSLLLASPPVATRNGLASLLPECAILTHKLCYKPSNSYWKSIAVKLPEKTPLDDGSLQRILKQYREGAEGTSTTNPRKSNASYKKMHASYKQLRMSEAGRRGIIELMKDSSPHVRCWAAAHSLEWVPMIACEVLREVRDNKGPCSFDAEITLEEHNKGTLRLEN